MVLASLLLASPTPASADTRLFGISIPFFDDSSEAVKPEEALQAFERGEFETAQEQFEKLLKANPPRSRRTSYAYGLGSASRAAEKYDKAVDAFSEALKSDEDPAKLHAYQGLAHSLYDQGDRTLLKAAEKAAEQQEKGKVDSSAMERMAKFTVKAWQDSIKHFDAALEITPDDEKIRENRDFVQKRLDELQQMMEQQQQQQQGGEGDQQQQDQGEGDQQQQGQNGDQQQEGQSGKQPGDQDGHGQKDGDQGDGGDQDKGESLAKEGNENQKGPLPEGQIEAADGAGGEDEGEEEEGMSAGNADERNEDTGFSANEARAFLRSYADDQKSVELRQQREPPANGKDW